MLRKVPHTYVIIFAIIVLAAISTWFIPGGEYVEQPVPGGDTELVFRNVDNVPQTWQVFAAMFRGFERQAYIIVFILMIGGAFWIMNASKAIDVGILSFVRRSRSLERFRLLRRLGIDNIIMVLIMLMFSIFGAVFGMSEETIAFIIILVPMAVSMGYDSITGVALVFVAAGLGFAGAVLNPFTIGIAQGLSGIDLFTGWEYRIVCWIVINLIGFTYIIRYARRVGKNPRHSPVYEEDAYWRERGANVEANQVDYHTPKAAWFSYAFLLASLIAVAWMYPQTEMSIGRDLRLILPALPIAAGFFAVAGALALMRSVHFYILVLLAATILYLIIGVMGYAWFVMEIATLFFAMGIFSGIAMNYSANHITKLFLDGARDIMGAALVVGLAGGIIIVLEDGMVIDTILHAMSTAMKGSGEIVAVGAMYVIQTGINMVIPSASAKAALTMPIMAPFSDLIGVSRQATVMAFQFGDGFTNMITPTSGVLIGVLGVARIPYHKWVRWIWPFMLILTVLGFLLLLPTVLLELNGF